MVRVDVHLIGQQRHEGPGAIALREQHATREADVRIGTMHVLDAESRVSRQRGAHLIGLVPHDDDDLLDAELVAQAV